MLFGICYLFEVVCFACCLLDFIVLALWHVFNSVGIYTFLYLVVVLLFDYAVGFGVGYRLLFVLIELWLLGWLLVVCV